MNREEKGIAYDNILLEGDKVNRRISSIKSSVFLTQEQEDELVQLKKEAVRLENKLRELFEDQ